MIDFKTEIKKYEPIMELEQVGDSVSSDEIRDVIDMLQHLTRKE